MNNKRLIFAITALSLGVLIMAQGGLSISDRFCTILSFGNVCFNQTNITMGGLPFMIDASQVLNLPAGNNPPPTTYSALNISNGTFKSTQLYVFKSNLTVQGNLTTTNLTTNTICPANYVLSTTAGGTITCVVDQTGGGGSFTSVTVEAANISSALGIQGQVFGANTTLTNLNYTFPSGLVVKGNLTTLQNFIGNGALINSINFSATNFNGITGLPLINTTWNGITNLALTNTTWNGVTIAQSNITGITIPLVNASWNGVTISQANITGITIPLVNASWNGLTLPQSNITGITIPLVNASWNGLTLPQSNITGITIPATNVTAGNYPTSALGIYSYQTNLSLRQQNNVANNTYQLFNDTTGLCKSKMGWNGTALIITDC